MTDWLVEPREVPPELTEDYEHATFPPEPVQFASWTEQLNSATWDTLKAWANGGTGNA